MSDAKSLLLRGSALRAIALVASVGVAFFMMPFIIHSVGDRWYGMWALVGTVMGYYGYFDFGVSIATQRYIAAAIGRQDEGEINRLFTTSFAVMLALAALSIAVTLVIAAAAPVFLEDPGEIGVFRTVLFILAANVAFNFAIAPVNGLITGHLRFDLATYIDLGKLAVRTALIVIFIGAGYSIVALAAITFAVDVAGNLVKLVMGRRMFRALALRRAYFERGRIGELLGYGGKTFVDQLADLLRFQVDHLVIAAFINLSAVTLYNIAGQLVLYFRYLISALMGVLLPLYARYQAQDDRAAVAKAYYFTSKLSTVVAVFIGGAAIIFGEPFIRLWMGPAYVDAYELLVVLMIPMTLYVSQSPANGLIYGLGAVGKLAKFSVFEASTNLALSVVLVQFFGLIGVALGTAIPLTFLAIYMFWLANSLVDGGKRVYLRRVGPVFLWSVAAQAAAFFIVQRLKIDSFFDIFMWAAVIYTPGLAVVLIAAFSREEIRLLRSTSLRALGVRRA